MEVKKFWIIAHHHTSFLFDCDKLVSHAIWDMKKKAIKQCYLIPVSAHFKNSRWMTTIVKLVSATTQNGLCQRKHNIIDNLKLSFSTISLCFSLDIYHFMFLKNWKFLKKLFAKFESAITTIKNFHRNLLSSTRSAGRFEAFEKYLSNTDCILPAKLA